MELDIRVVQQVCQICFASSSQMLSSKDGEKATVLVDNIAKHMKWHEEQLKGLK